MKTLNENLVRSNWSPGLIYNPGTASETTVSTSLPHEEKQIQEVIKREIIPFAVGEK